MKQTKGRKKKSAIVDHPFWDRVSGANGTTYYFHNEKYYKFLKKLMFTLNSTPHK